MVFRHLGQRFQGHLHANRNHTPQLGGSPPAPPPPDNWFDTDYKNRLPIMISSGVVGILNDFPLVINDTLTDLIGNVKADGGDIRFALEDKTELKSEIQEIDDSTGRIVAWSKVPMIQVGTNLFMYFKNPAATLPIDPFNVWDSNFKAVWHNSQVPAGANSILDSTINGNHGTPTGTSQAAGLVGNCLFFNGFADIVNILENGTLDITGQLTVSALTQTGDNVAGIIGHWLESTTAGYRIVVSGNLYTFSLDATALTELTFLRPNTAFNLLTGTRDSNDFMRLYVNTLLVAGPTLATGAITTLNTIGEMGNGLGEDGHSGLIDEVRISNVARSADRILADFVNMFFPATFYTVGPLETIP